MDVREMICIVSWNEKEFWQADVYSHDEGDTPIWFCTGKKESDMFEVITKASDQYPGISFHQGISGICEDCQTEYIYHESDCAVCGSTVTDVTDVTD